MDTISPSLYYRFYRYGAGCRIASDGVLSLPEQTAIGTGVLVRDGYRWDIPSPAKDGSPRILIGDRCECNRFLTIIATGKVELNADVIIAPHVYIADARQAWEEGHEVSSLTIGEGSWIGAHSSILGHVKIGKGCVVGAGSVVLRDVPDYCVVAGNPAEFRRIYEPSSGEWISVRSEGEAQEVLERRGKEPLLSICIPVRHQASRLWRCLESIYTQVDDDGLIEVCVLDNAETDETEDVAHYFSNLHRSFHYHRNSASTDQSTLNIQAAGTARGKFIMLHESGAPFLEGTLTPFLNVLHTYPNSAAVLIQSVPIPGPPRPEGLEGLSEFLRHAASCNSSLLPIVLNRQEWEETSGYMQGRENLDLWMLRQYALLQSNPHFCLCRYKMIDSLV